MDKVDTGSGNGKPDSLQRNEVSLSVSGLPCPVNCFPEAAQANAGCWVVTIIKSPNLSFC